MDTVRFGRALGIGTRAAAKALVSAADAATSPKPEPASRPASPSAQTPKTAGIPASSVGQKAARTVAQAKRTGKGIREGGKRFGEAIWGPVAKLSGVLWLEFTGVFFALFALFAGAQAWSDRGALHDLGSNHAQHRHLLVAAAMAVVFGYFCVSSFVNASRRGRR